MSFKDLFQRLYQLGVSKAEDRKKKKLDPIQEIEERIRDQKAQLTEALKGLAEVKAVAVRSQKEVEAYDKMAVEFERKAMLFLTKGSEGSMSEADADRYASQALVQKNTYEAKSVQLKGALSGQVEIIGKLDSHVQNLKMQILEWENNLKMLKARDRVSDAAQSVLQGRVSENDVSTDVLLDSMRLRIEQKEELVHALADLDQPDFVDKEVDAILGIQSTVKPTDELLAMKNQLRLKLEEGEKKQKITNPFLKKTENTQALQSNPTEEPKPKIKFHTENAFQQEPVVEEKKVEMPEIEPPINPIVSLEDSESKSETKADLQTLADKLRRLSQQPPKE